jgi:hypothetical protein
MWHVGLHDSRPLAPSKELDLANLGLSWPSSHQPVVRTPFRTCAATHAMPQPDG